MKKLLVVSLVILSLFLTGCDFLNQTSEETTSTISTVYPTYTEFPTTSPPATVDDVAYETLFDDSIYKKFIISFSEANFLKLIDDMENYFDEFGSYRDNTIQEVDVTYIDDRGNILVLNEVGFRTKGNIFSRVLPVIKEGNNIVGYQQVAFQLEFNDTFDYPVNSTEYSSLKSRDAFDLEQLNFKNIRSSDFGVVTESIAYDFYREAGVVTSNTSYAIVYFDIEGTVVPYGLFLLQEPIDDVFIERYFGKNQDGSIGDLYKCTWQTEPASLKNDYEAYSLGVSDYNEGYRRSYALKTNENVAYPDFSSFTDFIDIVNQTTVSDYYSLVSSTLVMDAFARAMAMGFLIGSPDDFRSNANNYYLYFNNNHVYYIPFDMDNSLGWGWNPYEDFGISLDIDSVQPSNYSWYGSVNDFVLVYNLFESADFKDLYNGYLNQFTATDGEFSYQTYFDEFMLIRSLYRAELDEFEHLGLRTFNLDTRWMPASSYISQKKAEVQDQLSGLGY